MLNNSRRVPSPWGLSSGSSFFFPSCLWKRSVLSSESERLQKNVMHLYRGACLEHTGLSRWISARCTGSGPGPTRLVDLNASCRDEHQPIRVISMGATHGGGSAYLPTYVPTYIPTYLPACLPTYVTTYRPTYGRYITSWERRFCLTGFLKRGTSQARRKYRSAVTT